MCDFFFFKESVAGARRRALVFASLHPVHVVVIPDLKYNVRIIVGRVTKRDGVALLCVAVLVGVEEELTAVALGYVALKVNLRVAEFTEEPVVSGKREAIDTKQIAV